MAILILAFVVWTFRASFTTSEEFQVEEDEEDSQGENGESRGGLCCCGGRREVNDGSFPNDK